MSNYFMILLAVNLCCGIEMIVIIISHNGRQLLKSSEIISYRTSHSKNQHNNRFERNARRYDYNQERALRRPGDNRWFRPAPRQSRPYVPYEHKNEHKKLQTRREYDKRADFGKSGTKVTSGHQSRIILSGLETRQHQCQMILFPVS